MKEGIKKFLHWPWFWKRYTEGQWKEEMEISSSTFCGQHWAAGSCKIPCPKCGTIGFYGPRHDPSGNRKYRACKFCGFWQEVCGSIYDERGGKPYRCITVYCEKCKTYNWHLPWIKNTWHCPNCKTEMKIAKWASDDSCHPFHKLKEQMNKIHQNL
jgi:hypothetical protein